MARMTRKRSLTELSRKSRMQFDLSKKEHSSGMGFGQPWLMTFKWVILSPNGSFRNVSHHDVDLQEMVTTHEAVLKIRERVLHGREAAVASTRLLWGDGNAR